MGTSLGSRVFRAGRGSRGRLLLLLLHPCSLSPRDKELTSFGGSRLDPTQHRSAGAQELHLASSWDSRLPAGLRGTDLPRPAALLQAPPPVTPADCHMPICLPFRIPCQRGLAGNLNCQGPPRGCGFLSKIPAGFQNVPVSLFLCQSHGHSCFPNPRKADSGPGLGERQGMNRGASG